MADEILPPLLTDKQHKKLAALLKLQLNGGGGIECHPSPDGSVWTIIARRRKGKRLGSILLSIVQVTGNATCGGVYTCRKWKRPAADVTAMNSATFSMTDLGSDPGVDDGYLFNLPETGKTTHDLTDTDNTGNAKLVVSILWYTNSTGKNIYLGIQIYPGCS